MTDTTDSLRQDIEALFTKRAAARYGAIVELGARGGDALIPAVAPLLTDSKKARRDLGWQLLGYTRPTTDAGREALLQAVREGLASKKDALRAAALNAIFHQGQELSAIASDLAHFIATEKHDMRRGEAARLLDRLGRPDAEVIAAVTPLLDSWSDTTRAEAAALIRKHGGTPRVSVWEGCPLGTGVILELQRLGAEPMAPFNPEAPRPLPEGTSFYNRERGSWSGKDPLGQLEQLPPAIWYFTEQIRWSGSGFKLWDRDFGPRKLSLSGATENFDQELNGKRRLLHVIGYIEPTQYFACLDLLDTSADPVVWFIDHDGSGAYIHWHGLSFFLRKVSAEKKAAKSAQKSPVRKAGRARPSR